jgi:DNA-binding transcriptional regulator LsrR (DeoR family)
MCPPSSDVDRMTIAHALNQAALDNGKLEAGRAQVKKLLKQDMAKLVAGGMRPGRVGELCADKDPKTPTTSEVALLANALHLSIEEMIDRDGSSFLYENDGVVWRLAGVPTSTQARACRIATARLLLGQSQNEIREALKVVYAATFRRPLPLNDARLRDMVQGGLAMGLARFERLPGPNKPGPEDHELAERLEDALARDLQDTSEAEFRPVVRVVKNVAHESFSLDPVAPFLIARVAHEIVSEHILAHETVYSIGLAGGTHCSTFVRTTGAESSPFPDDSGDKQVTFVPLTLEPFGSHQLPMADAVVGQMVSQARCLLGSQRVDGLTLQSFGYLEDEKVSRLDDAVITLVRQKYRDLDIAIYGCGDLESDGWLERAMRRVKIEAGVRPATDVCLNLLAEDGSSIPLPHGREFVGVGLPDIRRLVGSPNRLALLLTSGPAKGRPIVVTSRAGCTDTIVCDQAAAAAALDVLGAR